MKHLKTLVTLFLLAIGTGLSWADVTYTWDFTDSKSSAAAAAIVGEGYVDADKSGVALHVFVPDGGKFNSADRHKYGNADVQINAPVTIQIPVKSTNDVVEIVNYPGYGIGYTIGTATVASNVMSYSYSVTADDVSKKYAEVKVTASGYVLNISVTQSEAAPTSAEERTATWDWQNNLPVGIRTTHIETTTGKVNSNIDGVVLDVDATSGKFGSGSNSQGYFVQINNSTVVNVPVRHAGDVVTVVAYPGQYVYTVGGVAATGDVTTYTATEADASNHYVSIVGTGTGYIYSISVKQIAYSEEPEEESELVESVTAIWHWKKPAANSVTVLDTDIKKSTGYVRSNVEGISLFVDADVKDGAFIVEKSGSVKVAHLTKGATIMVPIRRAGDVVTITCPSKQNNYDVGGEGNKEEYIATTKDAENGYVLITAVDDTRFWEIKVFQDEFKSVLPMIKLNAAGWASFTSLVNGYVAYLPSTAKAYVATGVDYEGTEGTVTLQEVSRFTYGEGVFIKGTPYAEVYAKITTKETSDVPEPTGSARTEGCLKDLPLYKESNAFVVATYNGKDGVVAGFFRVKDEITVPAGKAYLYVENAGDAKSLSFRFADGEEATGIESVVAGAETKAATVFYNLAGQVVGKDYKGIVIGNDGKKYVK